MVNFLISVGTGVILAGVVEAVTKNSNLGMMTAFIVSMAMSVLLNK